MPIQIYSVQTRGYNMGGNQRCSSKEEAEGIYNQLFDAISTEKPIVEIELGGNKMCFRTKDLTGFGIAVHLEETTEEIKARQIAQIENSYQGYLNQSYPEACAKISSGISGGLF